MTDLQTALATSVEPLDDYKGRPIVRTTIALRNAGDGLSEGMSIEPVVYEQGSEVSVLVRCKVADHNLKPITEKGTDLGMLELEQVLRAGTAVVVDADLGKELLDAQATRVEEHRRQMAEAKALAKGGGVQQAMGATKTDEELVAEHREGAHDAEPVGGCELCEDAAGT